MQRMVLFVCVVLASACSGESDRVSGGDPKRTLDNVQQQIDAAGEAAEARVDDALEQLDREIE